MPPIEEQTLKLIADKKVMKRTVREMEKMVLYGMRNSL